MKQIKMIKIDSSQLDSAGYDEETNEMYIEFSSGVVYKYIKVPKRVFDKLTSMNSSAGSYFYSDIRMVYNYVRMEYKVNNLVLETR